MIDSYKIKEIARFSGLRPWQQEKHYLQSLILDIISDFRLIFKGGTYLWFFHGLNRFSDDLDFTPTGSIKSDLPAYISSALTLFGFENELKIMKNRSLGLSIRYMINGPLNTNEKDKCVIYVEISKREKIILPSMFLKVDFPQYDIPVKTLRGMNLDEVGAEKIRAILTREKGRDIYDLFHLISRKNILLDTALINEKLSFYNLTFDSAAFLKKIESRKTLFVKEMRPIIFGDLPEYDYVQRIIEKWIVSHK